jgi:hypothetical protein
LLSLVEGLSLSTLLATMPTALDDPPSRVYPLTASESPPMNIYSYSSKDFANPTVRAKRRQVKNACTNCQRACKKCDDARPCLRCVKYGIGDECVDSQRKERKKGVKRGPYKKRDGKGKPCLFLPTRSNLNP